LSRSAIILDDPVKPIIAGGNHVPTIEFFGYDADLRDSLESQIRQRLSAEPFRRDCVFVGTQRSWVRDWEGASRPFVRVSTRSAERAGRFKEILADLCDLEVVRIEFQPASS
jgi:hypothetical protein